MVIIHDFLARIRVVFVVPALAFLVYVESDSSQRRFATVGWLAIVLSICSVYVLMATLRNELFPSGTLWGGTAPHVRSLGSLQYQASRGKDGGLFDPASGFWLNLRNWIQHNRQSLSYLNINGKSSCIGWKANLRSALPPS